MDGKGSKTGISSEELRRGPWTVDEDLTLMNYIATHGEGRWNTLALSAGLKRTGKSCRLRWLNYLRPDVRRGNITLEEQLVILELHSRWGNRWSKIAQYLPGRTDNEIKNYWRTRVQKHAKQLKCDVNSKQFKDAMRYLWMPRLVERIQAANNNTYTYFEVQNGISTSETMINTNNNVFRSSHSSASSDSFGTTQVSDYNNYQITYSENNCPSGMLTDFHHAMMEPNTPWMQSGESCDNFWNVENMLFLQQQLMNDNNNM